MRDYHRNNKLGVPGVHEINGKYRTIATFGKGKIFYVGTYNTVEEAAEQYRRARAAGPDFKKHWEGGKHTAGKWIVEESAVAAVAPEQPVESVTPVSTAETGNVNI